jgi:hypothetical protein
MGLSTEVGKGLRLLGILALWGGVFLWGTGFLGGVGTAEAAGLAVGRGCKGAIGARGAGGFLTKWLAFTLGLMAAFSFLTNGTPGVIHDQS